MKINLFDGFIKFDFDWKAVVGVGIIILGCALFTIWGGEWYERTYKGDMELFIWNIYRVFISMDGCISNSI